MYRSRIDSFKSTIKYYTKAELKECEVAINDAINQLHGCNEDVSIADIQREKAKRDSKKAAKSREKLQSKGRELGKTVKAGDLVRVVGAVNSRYNWRLVTSIIGDTVCGWQYSKSKNGKWVSGPYHTSMQTANIREIVRKEDHGIELINIMREK